ncbi:MAG: hypothetical protein HOV87_02900 [Catenulispora sp.]|nr:hypothetical protein [Catenulispora sp.]
MPKIDWTPGLGRRGRPLRRVLGMGQRQGLIVLSGLAAVIVLLAVISALGGFDDSGGVAADYRGRTDPNADGGAAGGADGAAGADGLTGSAEASKLLTASVQHYAGLFADGQKIVGTTHYPDAAAYGKAFLDKKSPAAALSAFRISSSLESDTSYLAAGNKAGAAYGHHHSALNQWTRDMEQARADLASWVETAVQYQQAAAKQADLDAAASLVTQDLAKAQADIGPAVS